MTTLEMTETVPEVPAQPDERIAIRQAAIYLDCSEQYMRAHLVRKAKIAFQKDEQGRWYTLKSTLDAYKAAQDVRRAKATANGAKKATAEPRATVGKLYVIRVKSEVNEAVREALAAFDITLDQRYNTEKMKAYQKARKEKLRAEKLAKAGVVATPPTEVSPAPTESTLEE